MALQALTPQHEGDVALPYMFEAGDRVFVLLGDTPMPGIIESPADADAQGGRQWNVKTASASHAYPVPEGSQRPHSAGPDF